MKIEFVNPFVSTALEILQSETGAKILQRGSLSLQSSSRTSKEVTILIAVTGSVSGLILYGMTEDTALKMVSAMSGEQVQEFDAIAQSAIAELGNIITGNASIALENAGYPCTISPPSLIIGKNTQIATFEVQRMVIPVITSLGGFEIDIALKENK